jgi:hypothetical protein
MCVNLIFTRRITNSSRLIFHPKWRSTRIDDRSIVAARSDHMRSREPTIRSAPIAFEIAGRSLMPEKHA